MYKKLLNEDIDITKPVEIAKDIYWVGYVIPNDPFQCHVYLIKNGKESVLIDPGSMITFPVTLQKITSIIQLEDIKYIILHHQDPDIVGCVSMLEQLIPRDDLCFITHWRTKTLLKHYQWKTPFWLIDENDWKLKLNDSRELEFIFTPYAHFAGAFCTYDKTSGILFSSDIFGGLTDEFSLFAKDESYFESLKLFHIHYMPSKSILNHTLNHIEACKPELIAPQHGSIIHKELIEPIISKMRDLDCGLYMLDDHESDILLLNKTDEFLHRFFEDILSLSSFNNVLLNMYNYIKNDIKELEYILLYIMDEKEEKKLIYIVEKNNIYKPKTKIDTDNYKKIDKYLTQKSLKIGKLELLFNDISKKEEKLLDIFLNKIMVPFSVSFNKEISYENLKEKSITDPLTSLYNRAYLNYILEEEITKAKQNITPLSIAMIDIDFFKKINDTYGHINGDCVLKSLSHILKSKTRQGDSVIRYGGEEILIIMPGSDINGAKSKMEYIREYIENETFCDDLNIKLTVSIGIAQYKEDDDINSLIEKADINLYKAKKTGRNKVVI